MTARDKNTVVVGAGIVGLSIAFRLVRAGYKVMLIDRAEPGSACSYGNAGHVATEQIFPLASPSTVLSAPGLLVRRDRPLSIRPEYAAKIAPWLARFTWAARPASFRRGTWALARLQAQAMDSLRRLLAEAGIESQLHRRGHLVLVESEASKAAAKAQLERLNAHGVDAEWLDPPGVAELAPELKPGIAGGIRFKNSGHVGDPFTICRKLLQCFVESGGEFVNDEVLGVRDGPDGFELRLGSTTLQCGHLVIAAGAWSGPLAEQLGCPVPLDTERGYHINADGWHGKFDIAIASFERMTIMTPLDGGLRITGFVEFGGLELPPSQARLDRLKRHLRELLPGADFPVLNEWMGFRPSLPDHLPVIGNSPRDANATFAFGHQHLGLTLAGVTADAVTALVSGHEPPVDVRPFRIDRFR